jgi:hypothetical protein
MPSMPPLLFLLEKPKDELLRGFRAAIESGDLVVVDSELGPMVVDRNAVNDQEIIAAIVKPRNIEGNHLRTSDEAPVVPVEENAPSTRVVTPPPAVPAHMWASPNRRETTPSFDMPAWLTESHDRLYPAAEDLLNLYRKAWRKTARGDVEPLLADVETTTDAERLEEEIQKSHQSYMDIGMELIHEHPQNPFNRDELAIRPGSRYDLWGSSKYMLNSG